MAEKGDGGGEQWGFEGSEPGFSPESGGNLVKNPIIEAENMYQNQPPGYYGPQSPGWDDEDDDSDQDQTQEEPDDGRVPTPEEKEKWKERLYKCFKDPDYLTPGGNARCKLIAEATGIKESFVRSVWANYKRQLKKDAEAEVRKKEGQISIMEREAELAQREARAKSQMATATGGFGGDMLAYMSQMDSNRIEVMRIEAENRRHQEKLDHERRMAEEVSRRADGDKMIQTMMGFMKEQTKAQQEMMQTMMENAGGPQRGGGGMFMETGDPEVDAMLKQRQLEGMFGTGWGPAIRDALRPGGAVEMGMRALQGGQAAQQQFQMAQQNRFNPNYNPYQQLPAPQPQYGPPPAYSAYQNQGMPPQGPPMPAPQPAPLPQPSAQDYENGLINSFREDWPAEHLNILQDQVEITVQDVMARSTETDPRLVFDKMGRQVVVVQKLRELSQGLFAIFEGTITPERSLAIIKTDEVVSDWLDNISSVDEIYRIAELYSNTGAVAQEYEFLSQGPVRDLLTQMFDAWHGRKSVESIVIAQGANA